MQLESLANELLLDIFEYFHVVHLFRAFYGLNLRLNQILCTKIQHYHLDIRSISKHDFDNVCQQLPSIINRVTSLHLSNENTIPNLSKTLFSHGFTLDQFVRLRSLSLYDISSIITLRQITFQCRYLPYLTHLHMIQCSLYHDDNDIIYLFNNIWSLSKLNYLNFHDIYRDGKFFSICFLPQSTIRNLFMENISCNFQDLYHLFKSTPCLQRLRVDINFSSDHEPLQITLPSLISIKFKYHGPKQSLISLLKTMPNLSFLTIDMVNTNINGHEWKQILIDYVSKIKLFQMRMNLNSFHETFKQQIIDELLDTFQTDFWIKEHQWFIRCDWDPLSKGYFGILYTLPYAFDEYIYSKSISSKSTCISDEHDWSYNRVKKLQIGSFEDSFNNLSLFHARFCNIHTLTIFLPFNEDLWSFIPTLNRLNLLRVRLMHDEDFAYSQLQILLNRTSCLYSLTVAVKDPSQIDLSVITCSSIRRLDFWYALQAYNQCFNSIHCIALAKSSIGLQCEILLISVEYRTNILDLISAMPNLRSLSVRCKDDTWDHEDLSSTNDELIEWLRSQLPFSCTIIRSSDYPSDIELWLEK